MAVEVAMARLRGTGEANVEDGLITLGRELRIGTSVMVVPAAQAVQILQQTRQANGRKPYGMRSLISE